MVLRKLYLLQDKKDDVDKDGEHQDDQEQREGESGEQAAGGVLQQVTFLPTVRRRRLLGAFGQEGASNPAKWPNARLMFRMAKRKGHLINSLVWDAHTAGTRGYNAITILTLM